MTSPAEPHDAAVSLPDTAPVVVYHGRCADGFAGAWSARHRWPDAEFVAQSHADPVPMERLRGRDVVCIDFAFPRDQHLAVAEVARSLVVLDHHVTARDDLAGLPGTLFDLTRSGAGLAWDVLNPTQRRPWVIEYVEDRDLWRWALPDARAVCAALDLLPHTFDAWDAALGEGADAFARRGRVVLAYQQRQLEQILRHRHRLTIAGHDVPAVCSPVLTSELGHALAPGEPFAAVWRPGSDGSRAFGLRSTDGGLDVSVVAARYGGGGHPRAAGFLLRPGAEL